jgi:hypothetical protein
VKNANLTISKFFEGNVLFFTVNTNLSTSTTIIYVSDKGMPAFVYTLNGTTSWNYDGSNKTLTLDVVHSGRSQILVDWRAPGDVNGNGVVSLEDASIISAHWYPGPPVGPLGFDAIADINRDGAVGLFDAAIVSAYWTGPPKGPLDP